MAAPQRKMCMAVQGWRCDEARGFFALVGFGLASWEPALAQHPKIRGSPFFSVIHLHGFDEFDPAFPEPRRASCS